MRDAPLPPRAGRQAAERARKSKPARKGRRPRIWLRLFFSLLGAAIIFLAAFAGYLYVQTQSAIRDIADQSGAEVASADRAQVKPLGFLLLGLDSRKETGSLNTDVMMVAALNPNTKTATVVTIPRDSLLGLDGYKREKANAYYAGFLRYAQTTEKLKGEDAKQYAREKTREMYEKFFGVDLDYTAVINFQGFADVVDALGGIDVYVDQDMRYVDHADGTNINLKKGEQTLTGQQALDFVRYRKSNDGTRQSSDFERNDRQSRVLGAILDKLKSLDGVARLGNVIAAVGGNMRTDIPEAQIQNLMKTYFGLSRDHVRFIALEGTWRSPYVYLDDAKLEEAKLALKEELAPEGRSVQSP